MAASLRWQHRCPPPAVNSDNCACVGGWDGPSATVANNCSTTEQVGCCSITSVTSRDCNTGNTASADPGAMPTDPIASTTPAADAAPPHTALGPMSSQVPCGPPDTLCPHIPSLLQSHYVLVHTNGQDKDAFTRHVQGTYLSPSVPASH